MRFSLALALLVVACGSKPPPADTASPPPVAPSGRAAQVVNATVLTNGCQDLGNASARLAESAMYQLVEGCTTVPGGVAQFSATLQPGGRIEITAASGQPDVVPICILKHALTHRVPLTRPCRLDVKIEQTNVTVPGDGGAG
ncbi:MAG TPA: hypothetical protein VIF09_29475 [Polyangiaceae bacterium]|jgi:hypothetical protein